MSDQNVKNCEISSKKPFSFGEELNECEAIPADSSKGRSLHIQENFIKINWNPTG